MNAASTSLSKTPSGNDRSRYLLVATKGMLTLVGLTLHVGCGNTISASPEPSGKSAAVPSTQTSGSSTAESTVALNPMTDSHNSLPPAAAPVRSELPRAEAPSENTLRSEASATFVQPTTVALVSTEESPASAPAQPAAETAKKPSPKAADTGKAPDPNRTNNYSFDDLKFDIEKDAPFERSMLPKKIEDYAGHRVSIRGFILPTSFQSGLTSFVLVRDNMECCFGPGAALYDCIVIEMAEGKSTDYTIRPVTVEGKFSIDEFIGPGRRHLAIYKIVADKVE